MRNIWNQQLEPANRNHQIAKRNFPSCSLRSQFTASQKPPLLFPNALPAPYCHSLVSRNCIRYMEPSQIATTNFSSLRSLTLRYASLNLPHQVALRGRRIPSPAHYSFAALAITALPDSPALRLQPYIRIRFLLTIGVYHELVNSNRITLYERQA